MWYYEVKLELPEDIDIGQAWYIKILWGRWMLVHENSA